MARYGISRPAAAPERSSSPPPHDSWDEGLLTGILELRLTTLPGSFVSPGTGRIALMADAEGEVPVQGAARRRGRPVIPGSGIKGAVRTLYEILSLSCDPHSQGECQSLVGEELDRRRYCEACSLFGCMGWRGRLSFSDADPDGEVDARVHYVAMPWEPQSAETPGEFRLYDLGDAVVVDPSTKHGRKAEKELAREGYEGRFMTRLNFWNVGQEELGRLLLVMGFAGEEGERFPLRLGAAKYDGQGAMRVEPAGLRLATPRREALAGEALAARWGGWVAQARSSPWGEMFLPKLAELAGVLSKKRRGSGS